MSCYSCRKFDMAHNQVQTVPRKWLGCDKLECTLYNEIKFYYRKHKTYEGFVIRLKGVRARVKHHGDYLWARKTDDWTKKPNLKEYLAVFVDCVYGSEP